MQPGGAAAHKSEVAPSRQGTSRLASPRPGSAGSNGTDAQVGHSLITYLITHLVTHPVTHHLLILISC
jgi:hypothetical protein